MDIDLVIDELSYFSGRFPKEALEWAIANPQEITPFLLAVLEHVAENPHELMEELDFMGHIYAMFLLAQFRDTRAYPLIVKYFARPGQDTYEETGDFITEDLPTVLASVSGGDTGPIESLIENPALDEFIQSAALDALVVLMVEGVLPRDRLVGYLRRQFIQTPATAPSCMWSNFISCAADIYPGELMPYISACFEQGLSDESIIAEEDVDLVLRKGKEGVMESLGMDGSKRFITDAVSAMSWWEYAGPTCEYRPKKGPRPKKRKKRRGKR